MNTFQILMLVATLYFAYHIYKHINTLEDKKPREASDIIDTVAISVKSVDLINDADNMYKNGDLEGAKSLLERALEIEPQNTEVLNKLAFITSKMGDLDRAIELYDKSIDIDGSDDLARNAIATLYKSTQKYEDAIFHYNEALEIDDKYPITHYNYANLLVEMGEYEDAQKHYERAIELDSEFNEAKEALTELKEKRENI